jgi:hypothetical protein
MSYPESLVRAVVALGNKHPSGWRYVSIIAFANGYSVMLSNDPTGWAGGFASRLHVHTASKLGVAARITNAIAARSAVAA